MWLILSILIGAALGFSSHIRGTKMDKVEGVGEGLAVVSGASWLFISLSVWWWAAIILAILVFALYLLALQALTQKSIGKIA